MNIEHVHKVVIFSTSVFKALYLSLTYDVSPCAKKTISKFHFRYVSHINGSEWLHGSKPKSFCSLYITVLKFFEAQPCVDRSQ